MGMWELYCAICGGPLSLDSDTAKDPLMKWHGDVRVKGVSGIVHYDNYGRFIKDGRVVAAWSDIDAGDVIYVPFGIHDQCYKLNDNKIPSREYKSGLEDYQEQFFAEAWAESNGVLWKLYDPRKSAKNKTRILGILGKRPGKDMTVEELRALCKKRGVKGYSKMKKAELIKKCSGTPRKSPEKIKMEKMTVYELKLLCREKGIKGYSKLKKADLIKKCAAASAEGRKDMTVAQLKALCREKDIKGYSGKNKAQLLKLCA